MRSTRLSLSRLCVLLGLVSVLLGCNTAKIVTDAQEIKVPDGLSLQQVQLAILSAIAERTLTPEQLSTANDTGANRGEGYAQYVQLFKGKWSVESIKGGTITTGLSVRSHYLRIAIHFDTINVWSEIADSRNLDQSGKHIHKKAIAWKDRLMDRVRAELGKAMLAGAFGRTTSTTMRIDAPRPSGNSAQPSA